MKAYIKICSLFVALTISKYSAGQHLNLSQYHYHELQINPANTAINNFMSATLHYRHQKISSETAGKTTLVSAIYPFLLREGRHKAAISISLVDDRLVSIANYFSQKSHISFAYNVNISANDELMAGIQIGYCLRRIDISGLSTGTQYVEDGRFNPNISNGEISNPWRKNYLSGGLGITYLKKGTDKKEILQLGISVNDMFNTNQGNSWAERTKNLYKWNIHGRAKVYDSQKRITWFADHITTYYDNKFLFNTGLTCRINLNNKETQNYIDLSAKYRTGQAVAAIAQFVNSNFIFGLSYEMPINLKNQSYIPGNTLELILVLCQERFSKKTIKRNTKKEKITATKKTTNKLAPKITPAKDTLKTPIITETIPLIKEEPKIEPEMIGTILGERLRNSLKFEFNKSELQKESYKYLDELVTMLQQCPSCKLMATGHTDDKGDDATNQKISLERAETVTNYLIKKGIEASRIKAVGMGGSKQLVPNSNEELRAKNRRVEFLFYK